MSSRKSTHLLLEQPAEMAAIALKHRVLELVRLTFVCFIS
jgi:hypothetical protein